MKIRVNAYTIGLLFAMLSISAYAQAQEPHARASRQNDTPARVEFRALDILARSVLGKRSNNSPDAGSGFRSPSSMPARGKAGLFTITPTATIAAPNLPVLGGGTHGRLTKWSGFTSSNSFIGDTTIFEDKYGNVGVGTDMPTSRLSVAGMIEALSGGFKFPDGTVQTTSASGSLFSVAHDSTLMGNGTSGSLLRLAVPLSLNGNVSSQPFYVLNVMNSADAGRGLHVIAGNSTFSIGGDAIKAEGGNSTNNDGGSGVFAKGGQTSAGIFGGDGVVGIGGESISNSTVGGAGIRAGGGDGQIGGVGNGGPGVDAAGGFSESRPGPGVRAAGGDSNTVKGGTGIFAFGGSGRPTGLAAVFEGDVNIIRSLNSSDGNLDVAGNLNVHGGTKNFKIDHPLDPENKYLIHAAIESSEVLNVYSGNVKLDQNGEATVQMPEWFQAINRDFRYSLTPVGAPNSGLYIAEEVTNNHFKIAGGTPRLKVSWQVSAIRSDPVMLKRPFKAEEEKSEDERGYYLNPGAYNQPEDKSVMQVRHSELIHRSRQKLDPARQRLLQSNDR
jgi:hypothetical protein